MRRLPILMVAGSWGWGTAHMLSHFGWKAAMGIVLSNGLYWFVFRVNLRRCARSSRCAP